MSKSPSGTSHADGPKLNEVADRQVTLRKRKQSETDCDCKKELMK